MDDKDTKDEDQHMHHCLSNKMSRIRVRYQRVRDTDSFYAFHLQRVQLLLPDDHIKRVRRDGVFNLPNQHL